MFESSSGELYHKTGGCTFQTQKQGGNLPPRL